MATTIKDSVDYPMMSTSAWWKLRKQFQQSLPVRVTTNTLASQFGMTPKSAGINLLSPLRKMGLIDSDGKTTDLANRWRDDDHYPLVCEEIRKEIYPQDLLEAFPGQNPPRAAIEKWFAIEAGVGESAKQKMAKLYLLLAEADPTKQDSSTTPAKSAQPAKAASSRTKTSAVKINKVGKETSNGAATGVLEPETQATTNSARANGHGFGPSLHIDIQIHIAPDASAEQIDQIFASMNKHLYIGNSE